MNDFKPARRAKAVAEAAKTKTLALKQNPLLQAPTAAGGLTMPEGLKRHQKIHWWLKNLSREQLIVLAIFSGILIAGVGYAMYAVLHTNPATEPAPTIITQQKAVEAPQPTTVSSRMTGVQVAPELNNLPVTGVMIENSPDARPQSGLLQADTVFEAIAEGGITRFLALYQESKPDYIGPVRSARPYYLDFLVSYDAAIAHAGGSGEALAQIRDQHLKDLDYAFNASTYQRVNNRYAPHNLYTSRQKLLDLQTKKGYTSSNYTGLKRKDKDSPSPTPNAKSIDFTLSSFLYNPHFDYDASTNSYKRSEGGKPHVDDRTGKQINPKVVVALVMPHHYAGIYSVYQDSGSGKAFIFQDGIVTEANWQKADRKSELSLRDNAGAAVPLNPGQTWFTLISSTSNIKSTP